MKKIFGRTVADALDEIGVWSPGDAIALGDYGVIKDDCFVRRGSIVTDFGLSKSLIKHSKSSLDGFFSTSKDGVLVDLAATQSTLGGASIQFASGKGAVISADKVESYAVKELKALAAELGKLNGWRQSSHVVTSMRRAGVFTVLLTNSGSAKIDIRAKPALLAAFQAGDASVSANLNITGAAGVRFVGRSGPISVGLHHLGFFNRQQFASARGKSESPKVFKLEKSHLPPA